MPLRCMDNEGRDIEAHRYGERAWEELRALARVHQHLVMPCCNAQVILKKSSLGTRFFAHKTKGQCKWGSESAEHLQLKQIALEEARAVGWNARTEVRDQTPKGEQWTADVLAWRDDERIAIEIQWSGQTNEETARRQRRYEESNVTGVWLLRQPGFPIREDLPAACIGGSLEEGLRVLIPAQERMTAHDRKYPERWGQSAAPEEFVRGVCEERFLFGNPHRKTVELKIQTGVMNCWSCGKPTRIVTQVNGRTKVKSVRWTLHDNELPHEVAELIADAVKHRPDIGTIRRRTSRAKPHGFISNGCVHCDTLTGRLHEREASGVEEEEIGTVDWEVGEARRHYWFERTTHWAIFTPSELEEIRENAQTRQPEEGWARTTHEGTGTATVRNEPLKPLAKTLPARGPRAAKTPLTQGGRRRKWEVRHPDEKGTPRWETESEEEARERSWRWWGCPEPKEKHLGAMDVKEIEPGGYETRLKTFWEVNDLEPGVTVEAPARSEAEAKRAPREHWSGRGSGALQITNTRERSKARPTGNPPFIIRCSRAPFSVDEFDILRRYGREFERLSNGERAPTTAAQKQFVDAARGKRLPETVYERVWTKYLMRVEWESDPANRAAMEARWRMPDDREDWKRMRGAVWSDVRRRAQSLDE